MLVNQIKSKVETVARTKVIFLVDALKLIFTCLICLLPGKQKEDDKPKEKPVGADERY